MIYIIYFIEDDRSINEAVFYSLKNSGFEVKGFERPSEFWKAMKEETPDLILLDIMLPEEDGLQILRKLRSSKETSDLPIIMVTAKDAEYDKVIGLDSGADDYMTKPFQSKELLARIRALTRRQNQITTMSVGNLTLDPNTYEMRAEKTIKLTNKEFKVMEVLIRNTNSYLGSEKIMDSIYDISSDTEIGVIWVFISTLRKKLDEIGSNYNIVTRKGVGYRLESTQKND